MGGFTAGAVNTANLGGNFFFIAFGGAAFGALTAGGLGGGICGGFGFGPGTRPLGVLTADVANASIRGFVVGTIASAVSGEKFFQAVKHGLLSAGIHAGGVAINTAFGYAVEYIRSGGGTPKVISAEGQSSIYFEVPGGRLGSFGNVVSGDIDWMNSNATMGGKAAPYLVRVHEIFHGAQSGVLGLAYVALHGLSMGLSYAICGNSHQCNPLERFLHPYPDFASP